MVKIQRSREQMVEEDEQMVYEISNSDIHDVHMFFTAVKAICAPKSGP